VEWLNVWDLSLNPSTDRKKGRKEERKEGRKEGRTENPIIMI
jgi:hypothetical protein